MEGLPERFKRLRKERGFTGAILAQPRYGAAYVSQIERGKRRPSPAALEFFASRLGVSPSYLRTGVPDDLPMRLRYQLEQAEKNLSEGSYRDAAGQAEKVLDECRSYDVPNLSSWAALIVADASFELDRFQEARERFERLIEKGGLFPAQLARATAGLAKASRAMGDLSHAAQIVESLLATQTDPPLDSAAFANLQSVLVTVYFERGDDVLAQRAAERALTALDESAPLKTQIDARNSAARVLAERGQWEEALRLAHEARAYGEVLANRHVLGKLYTALAFICLAADPPRIEVATRQLARAERLASKFGDEADLAYIWTERGRVALLRERYEEAAAWAHRSASAEGVLVGERGRALLLQGQALRALGRLQEAKERLRDALAIFEVNEAGAQVLECWRELGELAVQEGDKDGAVEAFRSGVLVAGGGRSSLIF